MHTHTIRANSKMIWEHSLYKCKDEQVTLNRSVFYFLLEHLSTYCRETQFVVPRNHAWFVAYCRDIYMCIIRQINLIWHMNLHASYVRSIFCEYHNNVGAYLSVTPKINIINYEESVVIPI